MATQRGLDLVASPSAAHLVAVAPEESPCQEGLMDIILT